MGRLGSGIYNKPNVANVDLLQNSWRALNCNFSFKMSLDDCISLCGTFLHFNRILDEHEVVSPMR